MKFKVGDWVRVVGQKDIEIVNNKNVSIFNNPKKSIFFKHWQPEEGEWCWYKDNLVRITNINEYGYIRAETATQMKQFDFESFKECEPFVGNLPSFIKG